MKIKHFLQSIQLKFIIIYILLLLVAVQVIGSYFAVKLEDQLTDNFKESVNESVDLLNVYLEQAFAKDYTDNSNEPGLQQEIQDIVNSVDMNNITTLRVVNNSSRILGANNFDDFDKIGKRATGDYINRAIAVGSSYHDVVLKEVTHDRIYRVVRPIKHNKDIEGAIYVEASLEGVYNQLTWVSTIFLKGSIWAIVVSALLGILVARTITKPIKEMRKQAQTMAKGDFTQKVNVYGNDEIGNLAETFNDMNDQLKHSYSTIDEERLKLGSVLTNMSDGVIATDETGMITLVNDAAARLLGKRPTDIREAYLPDILQFGEEKMDITELHDTGTMIIDMTDEDEFLLQAKFSTILDDEDIITGFITVISDVTEKEKVERERREFVSNVSHELRTPLTTMRSYIEALTDGAWEDRTIAPKFLHVTQNETERMIRMVNDLLQLSRMDNKKANLNMKRLDFTEYFHHIMERFEMNAPESIELVCDIPDNTLMVFADPDKLTQVLDNITSNAVKYAPNGGKVICKVEKRRTQLCVSIQDEGIGIAYEKLDKIFERFYRVDKARTRKFGGTGLGLAIASEIIEIHHGKIWATSKEGKGTTVFFTLPLLKQKRRGSK